MAYVISTENRGDYLSVSASGFQSYEDNLALASACMEECKKIGVKLLFVDITGLTGQPGPMADYQLVKLIDEWASNKHVSKAALYESASELDAGKFFETVAVNRGINIKVFDDKTEALGWLLVK